MIYADKIARISADAARVASEVAKVNSQLVIDTERARLMVSLVGSNINIVNNISPMFGDLQGDIVLEPIRFQIGFRNYGRTPAIITLMSLKIEMLAEDLDWKRLGIFEPDDDEAIIDGNSMSKRFTFWTREEITVRDVSAIRDGQLPLP